VRVLRIGEQEMENLYSGDRFRALMMEVKNGSEDDGSGGPTGYRVQSLF
jgi:hypothetical protein